MNNRLLAILVWPAGDLLLAGCCCIGGHLVPSPYDGKFCKERPNEQDLVGRWVGAREEWGRAKGDPTDYNGPHTIDLREDGTCVAISFIDDKNPWSGKPPTDGFSAVGRWKVDRSKIFGWVVRLELTREQNEEKAWGYELPVLDQKPPHRMVSLWVVQSGDGMLYKPEPKTQNP